jgi:hypothetical protein
MDEKCTSGKIISDHKKHLLAKFWSDTFRWLSHRLAVTTCGDSLMRQTFFIEHAG